MRTEWIVIGVVVAIVAVVIVIFNNLVRMRNVVREGWSGIDVQLRRRTDLVPNLVEVVKGKEGADPGAVAFEATKKAQEAAADFLLVDTAGRLHTKVNLMDEIKKVKKTIAKAMDGAPHETLLVIDATTGQNALTQAALFKEALDLTGLILTKLDGTAKGGIVLGVCDELKVPVRYIGLGERAEDLREFVPVDFVEALFGREDDEAAAA